MTDLYQRVAIVKAGVPGTPGREWSNQGADALKIVFEAELSTSSAPNKTTIDMVNLQQDSREFLSETPGLLVRLEAGYRESVSLLAQGDIAEVEERYENQDTITRITLGDGEQSYLRSRFNFHFGPGTSSAQVIERIRQDMGLARGFIDPSIQHITYPNGVTFTGDARDALDRVVNVIGDGAEWSIQEGALQALGKNDKPNAQTAVVLAPDSGLLSAKLVKKGVEVTSLLLPTLTPGRRIQVIGRTVEGFFVVRQVTHSGDSLPTGGGGAWQSQLKARRLGT